MRDADQIEIVTSQPPVGQDDALIVMAAVDAGMSLLKTSNINQINVRYSNFALR